MREYVLTLIGAALVTSLASMIAPEGKIGKYIAFAGGLCILCVSISPIYSFISGISGADGKDLPEYVFGEYAGQEDGEAFLDVYEKNLMDMGAENMSQGLKNMLCRDLKINTENIEVCVQLVESEEKYLPKKVSVVLYRSAVICDPREISGYVSELLGCECEVVYG
jgi:hypothetical protein